MWSWSSISRSAVALAAWTGLATVALAQDPAVCDGMLEDPDRAAEVLAQVPKYRATYVLVYPDRIAERLADFEAVAHEDVRVGLYEGSAATDLVGAARGLVRYEFASVGPGRAIRELLAGDLEAAVLWAPLAGLGILQLDSNYELSMRTLGEPSAVPAFIGGTRLAADDETSPCANEVLILLESYGVVPAEKLLPLDIEDLLPLEPPLRDLEAAARGSEIFQANCAKCHGQGAVAAPDALAPVDLLKSIRRFSFPGFLYIALNGREQNGMPGFRGALDREQMTLVYQYVRERSYGALGADAAEPTSPASTSSASEGSAAGP